MEDSGKGVGSGETVLKEGVIVGQLMEVLGELLETGLSEGGIAKAIDRHWVKILEECEDEPSEALQNYLLPELIFADQIKKFHQANTGKGGGVPAHTALDSEPILEELKLKDEKFWKELLVT